MADLLLFQYVEWDRDIAHVARVLFGELLDTREHPLLHDEVHRAEHSIRDAFCRACGLRTAPACDETRAVIVREQVEGPGDLAQRLALIDDHARRADLRDRVRKS